MSKQRSLFDFVAPPKLPPSPKVDPALLRLRRECEAARLGLPWPRPVVKRGAGRVSHEQHWHNKIYACILADPDSTLHLEDALKPAWWSPGMGLHEPEQPVAAALHVKTEQPVAAALQVKTEQPEDEWEKLAKRLKEAGAKREPKMVQAKLVQAKLVQAQLVRAQLHAKLHPEFLCRQQQ